MKKNKILFIIGCISIIGLTTIVFAQGTKGGDELTEKEKAFSEALRIIGTDKETENTWTIINESFDSNPLFIIRQLSGRARGIPGSRTKIIPFLVNVAMNHKAATVRLHAMRAISDYPEMEGVSEAIINMLKDEEQWNRQRALEVIIEKRLKNAIPTLKEAAAKEENESLKEGMEEAVKYLQKVKGGPKEALTDELNSSIKQLSSPDPQERAIAATALEIAHYEGPYKEKAIKALLKAYNKETVKQNKMQILASLSLMAEDDKRVISLLKKELASKEVDIRNLAEEILKGISVN